jgi:hypothetical protein
MLKPKETTAEELPAQPPMMKETAVHREPQERMT